MLLHVVKTKEGLVVMETPHKGKADSYMKRYGKDRKYKLTSKIVRKVIH